jgi:hypothetical protein
MCHAYTVNTFLGLSPHLTENARAKNVLPVGVAFFHFRRETDGRADMTMPIVIFRNRFEDKTENLWNVYRYQHGLLRCVGKLLSPKCQKAI